MIDNDPSVWCMACWGEFHKHDLVHGLCAKCYERKQDDKKKREQAKNEIPKKRT